MNYWLMKTEPTSFGIDALARAPRQTTGWDGIRNYQVRNMLRDDFEVGDQAFLYHSSCKVPGIYGIVTVTRTAYPDPTAFDPTHHHFDDKSNPDDPRWLQVDVKLLRKFVRPVTLATLKAQAGGALRDLPVLRRGNRLSITPVSAREWKFIVALGDKRD